MAHRGLHWWVLGLFPVVVIAFWPGYFADVPAAPLGFHLHVAAACAWLLLLGAQAWTATRRRFDWHRAAGRAVFVVAPLFAAGGLLMLRSMAAKFAGGHPFYGVHGARLGAVDLLLAVPAFLAFVMLALRHRRTVARHAAWMAATLLLMLPPVLARFVGFAMGLAGMSPAGVDPFRLAFHLGQGAAAVLALLFARAAGRHGAPFAAAAAVIAAQNLLYETVGGWATWERFYAAFGALPDAPLAIGGFVAAAALLATAWRPAGAAKPLGAL